jgi:hypothetical protein
MAEKPNGARARDGAQAFAPAHLHHPLVQVELRLGKTVMLAGDPDTGCSGSESCQANHRAKLMMASATPDGYP